MRLRALEIQGFKSFPDKTTLDFGGGITAVVGPNGSGKSNIADAVRWVLGEQSSKTLRGGKMEDVIFGGTQSRKPVGFASVRLTIDNADGALPVEGDTVTIARRLYRSGDSEYRINDVMVRLKDIHEMLMDTGLGRDGYSIIGQGRIAEIVSSKSQQRREIFEEAAGISKFRYRKEEAERKLSATEENLVRLRDILTELEDRVGPLAQQAEKAKEFLEYSGEKKTLEVSLWLYGLDNLKEQLSQQENKVYIAKNDYEALERESEAVEEKLNDIFRQTQMFSAQVEEKRASIKALQDAAAASESDIAVLQNDIRHNLLSVERLDKEIATAGLDEAGLKAQLEEQQASAAASAAALEALAAAVTGGEQSLADHQEQLEAAVDQVRQLAVRQQSVQEAVGEARLSKAAGETLLQESTARIDALRQNTTAHDAAVAELQAAVAECAQQITEREQAMASLENTGSGYTLKRESRAGKLAALEEKAAALEADRAAKEQRARLLEDLEKSLEGFAGSVKYILNETKKGTLRGIHGPVSSLIGVDGKYALAIETALGAGMQNIVVENEDTAKAAIRQLKQARAGRATFLPLTSVKGGRTLSSHELERHDGFIGVAAALVQADPRYEKIVSQLLGRVVVAEDLDAGTRMAKSSGYSFRVVTLDGQVINAGGSFTGGSSARSAGILGRRVEIDRLRRQAAALQQERDAMAPRLEELRQELSALDAAITGARSEWQTANEDKLRLGATLEQQEKNLTAARENRELAKKELENLTARLDELRGSDVTSTGLLEQLQSQLDQLGLELEAAREQRRALETALQEETAALAQTRMERLAAEKDLELCRQDVTRLEQQIAGMGDRARQISQERAELIASNAGISDKIRVLTVRIEERREQAAAGEAEIAAILERRTALEAESTGLRAQEREIASRREGVSRELARLEERRNTLRQDYDNIIAKLWDEYELSRSAARELAVELPDPDAANRRLTELRGKIKALGSVNVAAVEEYAQVSERYRFLKQQVGDVEEAKAGLLQLIGELTGEMRQIFTDNFHKIAHHFSKIFVELFGGGKGQLLLTNEEDVLESGVEIQVQPPGKIIKSLTLLSGGEQAFVAIAIYFAILKVRPAPFCLLDEIEAALDDVNVVKFATYLRQMCAGTQFIAITHRRGTMEEADMLYGVTMQDEGVSKLLRLNVSEVEEKLGMPSEA